MSAAYILQCDHDDCDWFATDGSLDLELVRNEARLEKWDTPHNGTPESEDFCPKHSKKTGLQREATS